MATSMYVATHYGGREKYEYYSNTIGIYRNESDALISTLNYLIDENCIDFESHYEEYLDRYFKEIINDNKTESESEIEFESESESESEILCNKFLRKEYKKYNKDEDISLDDNKKFIIEQYKKYKVMLTELKELFKFPRKPKFWESDIYIKYINDFKLYLKTKVNSVKDLQKICSDYSNSYYGDGWNFNIIKLKVE